MAGPGEPPEGEGRVPQVPPAVLRAWDEAEARLFPLVMWQPELYKQALDAVQRLLGYLRVTCQDLPALIAAHERGGDLVEDHAAQASGPAGAAGVPGVRPGLLAAAACASRYREIVALEAARRRLVALARAREQGLAWAVVEENGQPERALYIPYQRIEAEARTGRALVVSIGPDETLSRAVYRLDEGEIDLTSGVLRVGEPLGSYLDPGEFSAALDRAQASPA